jgi:hypothetical protein
MEWCTVMVHLNDQQHEMELSPAPSYGHSIALCLLRKNPKPLWFWDYFGPVFGPSPSSRCLNMSFEKILRLLGPCIVPGFLRHGICRLITSRRTRINGVPVQVLIHRFCLRACFEMVQNQRFGFKKNTNHVLVHWLPLFFHTDLFGWDQW